MDDGERHLPVATNRRTKEEVNEANRCRARVKVISVKRGKVISLSCDGGWLGTKAKKRRMCLGGIYARPRGKLL